MAGMTLFALMASCGPTRLVATPATGAAITALRIERCECCCCCGRAYLREEGSCGGRVAVRATLLHGSCVASGASVAASNVVAAR